MHLSGKASIIKLLSAEERGSVLPVGRSLPGLFVKSRFTGLYTVFHDDRTHGRGRRCLVPSARSGAPRSVAFARRPTPVESCITQPTVAFCPPLTSCSCLPHCLHLLPFTLRLGCRWAFIIWSLIFLTEAIFVVYQALPSKRHTEIIVEGIGCWFAIACILQV